MERRDTTRLDPGEWVDAYGDALFGFALARVKDHDVAEDLVQETYSGALGSRGNFRGHSSERTWLFGILKHKILDHLRRSPKILLLNDVMFTVDGAAMLFGPRGDRRRYPAPPATDPERDCQYRELLDDLRRGLARLPQRAAQVFIYREIDGLSTAEICLIFGISKDNCWTILHRAKVLLRRHLECYGRGSDPNGCLRAKMKRAGSPDRAPRSLTPRPPGPAR
jgi:RNA polymerase sigma-70 factor (ECF subfamily)